MSVSIAAQNSEPRSLEVRGSDRTFERRACEVR